MKLKFFAVQGDRVRQAASLTAVLDCESKRQIAFVGAGGKTTLLYALAAELAAGGRRVIVTTTTKIYQPPSVWTDQLSEVLPLLAQHNIITVGRSCGAKLSYIGDTDFRQLAKLADVVLIEADGSRRLPLKVPAAHEPVVPPGTDMTIGVIGLDAVGRPLGEVCHRAELAAALLGKAVGSLATTADIAAITAHESGIRKGCRGKWQTIINKVNTKADLALVREISRQLGERVTAAGWYHGK